MVPVYDMPPSIDKLLVDFYSRLFLRLQLAFNRFISIYQHVLSDYIIPFRHLRNWGDVVYYQG